MSKKSVSQITGKKSDVFQSIANTIHHVTSLPVSIWAPDKNKKVLKIVAAVGLPENYIQTASLDLNKPSVTGDAFKTKKIQVVRDINASHRWYYKEQAREMNWKSAICVPVEVDGSSIGAISVYSYTERSISELRHILPDFAKQIALTLETGRQKGVLQKILEIDAKLQSMSESHKSILKEIVQGACEITNADCAVVYPFDAEHGEFYDVENIASYGLQKKKKISEKPRSKGGMASYVKQEGEIVLTNIEVDEPKMLKTSPFIKREKIRAFMGIALKVGNDILGVLYVNFRTPHNFTKQEKNTIRLFAHQASYAVNNARLYQRLNSQVNALSKLHKVAPQLVSISPDPNNLNKVLKQIAEDAQLVLGADLVDLYQYNQNEGDFDLPPVQSGKRYEPQVKKEKIQQDDIILSIVKNKQTKYILDSQVRASLITPFIEKRNGLPALRFAEREKVKSAAAIPLVVGEEVMGVLFANYRTPQVFSSQQKNLIELFAAQAAIAIHNSRLYWKSLQRSKRLELVRKVSAAISSVTDVKTILQLAVDGLAKVMEVKQSAVALFDEAGEYAVVQVEYLEPGCVPAMGRRIPLKNNPQIDKILKTKLPLIIDDVPNDPIMDQMKGDMAERKTLSLMIVPIIIDDEVVGTIGIDAVGEKRRFTSEEAEFAQAIADQAATALQIAQQLDDRLSDIHALQDITEQMHQGDLNAVLNLIAERAIGLTGAKYGGVWLVSKDGTELEFGGRANKEQREKQPPNIPLDKNSENSFSKMVVRRKKSHLSGDVRKDKNYKPWYKDTRSELTVPIIYQDKVIGTINVESPTENSFTEDHKRLLEAMAGQAAIVVQNARLLEQLGLKNQQLEHHVKSLASLNDIGRELTSRIHLKEEKIFESIRKQAERLTGAKDMYIALYDEETGKIRFPLATQKGKRVQYRTREANMQQRGKTEEIILTRKPILHKTKKEAEGWYKQPGHEEFVGLINPSWLGVPMMVGKRVLGVLAVYDLEKENAYDEQDLQVFSSMASQAAIALDNANLYYDVNQKLGEANRQLGTSNQQLEHRVKSLASLNDIGRELTSRIHLKEEEILESIRKQAQQLTGAKDMYVALYDEETKEIRFPVATKNGKRVQYSTRKANMQQRGKTEEIILTRKPILHKTKKAAEEWYKQPGHEEFVGLIQPSWLGVPMMVGNRVLGVLAVYDLEKENAYDIQDLQVFSSMASQAAIALDNANLYYDVNQKLKVANQQLETILNIINSAELHSDLHEFLQDILNGLLQRVDAKNGTIQLYDSQRGELIIWAKAGNVVNSNYQHISLEMGITGKAAKEKRPIYAPDVKTSPDYVDYMSDTRSEFASPMLIGNTLIGVLNVEDPEPNAISLYNRQLIELLGNQIAILVRQKLIMRNLEEKKLVDQVNESLGLVTAEVAHKVGNAAGKIRFLTREHLQDASNINESQRKDIQIILRNVEEMIKATDDLFKPFGMEPKVEITVEEMVRVAIGQCATPKNIKISTRFEAGLPKVNVQVTKVQSYLAELLNNAIKYTIKGMVRKNGHSEKVEIVARRSKDGVVEIHFTNHGPAIPSENWESIFRVFSAKGQKSEDDQSYGLGLWGTRATMQQQGGDVFLLESDDKKTTFVVRFPTA